MSIRRSRHDLRALPDGPQTDGEAVASLVVGAEAEAVEHACAALGAARCRFAARRQGA